MNNRYLSILPALTLILCLSALPAAAEVTVEPTGLIAALAVDSVQQTPIIFHNQGVADATFAVQLEEIEQLGGRRDDPRRDEPGDLIAEFNQPQGGGMWNYCSPIGWDWDNDRMGVSTYANGQIHWFTHDNAYENFEEVATWDWTDWTYMDGCWLNGITFAGGTGNINVQGLKRYDAEGNLLDDLNLGYWCYSAAADVEENRLFAGDFNQWPPMIHVYQMDDNGDIAEELGSFNNYDRYNGNNQNIYNLEWVPKHTDGKLWMTNYANGNAYEIAVDEENWECTAAVQDFHVGDNVGNYQVWDAVAHDGHYLWAGGYPNTDIRIYDDGIFEPYWFIVEPAEGVVAAGDDLEVTGVFNAEGVDPGTYEMAVTFFFYADDTSSVAMSAVLTVDGDAADIYGVITDAATTLPVAGAEVAIDRYIYARYSDDDGNYRLPDLPLDEYTVTITATDFLPHTEAIDLNEAGEHQFNVALLHSECTPIVEDDEFFFALEPGLSQDLDFSVTNGGNGLLTYWVDRRLLGEANAEPWELRHSYNAEDLFENDKLNGVAFVDSLFYIAGSIRNQRGKIYIMDMAGNEVGSFDQWVASLNGMRDLTYDGELLWGADANKVVGFTTAGDSITSFQGPWNPIIAMTWDPDRQLLWASGSTTDLKAFDRQGNVDRNLTLNHPGDSLGIAGVKIDGMSYYADDPDGYNLYLICNISNGSNMVVVKMNPETGGARIVRDMDDGSGDRPRGLFITNTFDVYSWVMMSISAVFGGDIPTDRLNIIQLDARKEWMAVTPNAGTIDPGATEDFILTLDATGLPPVTFEGEVVFVHDGVGGETHIPVTLEVSEGRAHSFRRLNLHFGWNMVSVSLQPDSADIPYLTSGLVEAGSLRFMKDEAGNFYSPADDFNNIPGWSVSQGYLMKMNAPATWWLEGMNVLRDDTLHLTEGWHIVSYYLRFAVDAEIALSGIADHLVIAKDEFGNFYVPAWGFNNMGRMRDGKGYQMKVDADVDLVYQWQRGMPRRPNRGENAISAYNHPGNLPLPTPTGFNQSLLVLTEDVLEGDVGVYADGRLVGVGVLNNGAAGIAVWGDDPTTPELDGAQADESLTIRIPGQSVAVEMLQGDLTYRTDGFTVARLNVAETPTEFGIIAAYPNPFNARTRIVFSLPDAARVNLAVYDIGGRLVANLVDGKQEAGVHSALFDARDLPSGIYLVHLEAAGNVARQKLALVK